jgi:hypothetical protein
MPGGDQCLDDSPLPCQLIATRHKDAPFFTRISNNYIYNKVSKIKNRISKYWRFFKKK